MTHSGTWRRIISVGVIAISIGIAACDQQPAPPPPATQPEHPQNLRPTTQQLTEGPWNRMALGFVPISVEVPTGWEVKSFENGSLVFLEGPAPTDDIKIALSQRPTITSERLGYIESGAATEKVNDPKIVMDEFKDLVANSPEKGRLRERQVVRMATSYPAINANGLPVTDTSPPFSWTISLYVPRDKEHFLCYELNFIGLTQKIFDADKTFLRRLIDSIKYDESLPTTTK